MTNQERLQMIENALNWAKEGERRMMEYTFDPLTQKDRVWCYDYTIMEGQHIYSPSDIIDVDAVKERAERQKFEELSKKFAA